MGALAICIAYRDAEERAGGTSCVSGSVVVSLVAKGQYSTEASLMIISGFKLL